jgi:tetratricopeptide (TPR) repeat protein
MDDRRRKVARVNLIKALAASGQDAEARAECELFVATAGEPSNSDEAGWLASALGPLGRFREMGEARELALRMNPRGANEHDDLAWFLATVPDSTLRDAARAVELMREVVSPATSDPAHWNTFGVVLCMAGKWQESLDALRKSMDLRGGGDAYDWYFLAIDEKRLGRDAEARAWFDKAVAWTEANRPKDEELARFRREAGVTLGIDADRTSPAPETK